jgi:hypothetical protein
MLQGKEGVTGVTFLDSERCPPSREPHRRFGSSHRQNMSPCHPDSVAVS